MSCPQRVCRFSNYGADKTARELLIHSEASLHAIIENAAMTIYSLDREFRYLHFNSYLSQSLKQVYNVDIKIGDVVFDFLYKDDPEEANSWRNTYLKALAGEALEFIKEFNANGYHGFHKFFINPIKELDEVTGLTCVAIDITKERIAEIQVTKMADDLVKRNQNLEQYAYIIAHNLRAPIANLLGIANLLEIPEVSTNDKEEAKGHILNSARRLDDVIRDLSYILQSKEEINQHRESVQFQDLVDDVVELLESAVESSGAIIETDFSARSGIITVKAYLHSVFYNLISNSIRYSKPEISPVIKISSKLANGRVCLTFEDNGLGIDLAACRDKIFGLYKRFHPEVAEGKGMGLFMVRTHVETLGGKISIESEVDRGTIMTIQL